MPTIVVPEDLNLLFTSGVKRQVTHRVEIRSNFDNTWRRYNILNPSSEPGDESLVADFSVEIPYSVNHLNEDSAQNQIRMYSEIKWIVKAEGWVNGNTIEHERCVFHGHIDKISFNVASTALHASDPLAQLGKFYFNHGTFEATLHKIQHHNDDPTEGVLLVPVSGLEHPEERWIVPSHINGTDMYEKAYANENSDEAYVDSYEGHSFKAGTNRRIIKVVGRLYDTGMNLNTGGDDNPYLKYPYPLPAKHWQLGTDVPNYIEFKQYTPVGTIYVEFVQVYEEGTNEFEDIVLQLANPIVRGGIEESATSSTTIVLAARPSDFIRDSIIVGATIKNLRSGNVATIVKVNRYSLVTTAITGNWEPEDSFEIYDGVGKSPRWREGVHFELTGDYNLKTIFKSGITINNISWNSEDGSALDLIAKLLRENCPPNLFTKWDPTHQMLRIQYSERTPFNTGTPYYDTAFGKFIPPLNGPGTNDQVEVDSSFDGSHAKDDDMFASAVITSGIYEHPVNLIKTADQITTQPPGNAVSGWNHNSNIPQFTEKPWALKTDFDTKDTGSSLAYPGPLKYLIDNSYDTAVFWNGGYGIGEGKEFAPLFVVDLLAPRNVGQIVLYGLKSEREFAFGLRLESCLIDGRILDGGQWRINQSAEWTLMHPDYFEHPLKPLGGGNEVHINGGWLTSFCRYILVSMRFAKVHSTFTTRIGLTELAIYERSVVTGEARVADLTKYLSGTATGGNSTVLQDSSAEFKVNGVKVGDTVHHISSSTDVLVTAVNSETEIVTQTIAPAVWSASNYAVTKAEGAWVVYLSSGESNDDAIALLHMPKLANQCFAPRPADYGLTGDEIVAGHKISQSTDNSLSTSNACMERSREILLEQIRTFTISGIKCAWHTNLQQYHTVKLFNPRLNLSITGLVKKIRYRHEHLEFDADFYATGAWTGEEALSV